jgi:hypothetical protein
LLKLISQIGIVTELFGAAWLVYAAYKGHREAKESAVQQVHWGFEDLDRRDPLEGRLSVALQEIQAEFLANAREQWRVQLVGFALLAIGLAMQFVGGFGA